MGHAQEDMCWGVRAWGHVWRHMGDNQWREVGWGMQAEDVGWGHGLGDAGWGTWAGDTGWGRRVGGCGLGTWAGDMGWGHRLGTRAGDTGWGTLVGGRQGGRQRQGTQAGDRHGGTCAGDASGGMPAGLSTCPYRSHLIFPLFKNCARAFLVPRAPLEASTNSRAAAPPPLRLSLQETSLNTPNFSNFHLKSPFRRCRGGKPFIACRGWCPFCPEGGISSRFS